MIRVTLTCSVCAKEETREFAPDKVDFDTALTDIVDVMKWYYAQKEDQFEVYCSRRCED